MLISLWFSIYFMPFNKDFLLNPPFLPNGGIHTVGTRENISRYKEHRNYLLKAEKGGLYRIMLNSILYGKGNLSREDERIVEANKDYLIRLEKTGTIRRMMVAEFWRGNRNKLSVFSSYAQEKHKQEIQKLIERMDADLSHRDQDGMGEDFIGKNMSHYNSEEDPGFDELEGLEELADDFNGDYNTEDLVKGLDELDRELEALEEL
jgi:hypothetical protein